VTGAGDWVKVDVEGAEPEVDESSPDDSSDEDVPCVVDVLVLAAVELFFEVSPGSLPSVSWMKITPQAAMKAATDQATVRLRIRWTRSRRAARGSARATRGSGRGGGGGGGGEGVVVMADILGPRSQGDLCRT